MNDPHVEARHYRTHARENVRFDGVPALRHKTDLCELNLRDGECTVTMLRHFAHADAAGKALEPVLRARRIAQFVEMLAKGGKLHP
jgi:hypothetical protein